MPVKNKQWRNIISLTILLTVFIFMFEIIPHLTEVTSLFINWLNQSGQIEKLDEAEVKLRRVTAYNRNLSARISTIVSDYEENQKISNVLSFIDQIATGAKINIVSIKPGKIKKRNELWLQPIELTLLSNYEGFLNFVFMLENSPKVIIIKSIEIKPSRIIGERLKVNANIEVYLNL